MQKLKIKNQKPKTQTQRRKNFYVFKCVVFIFGLLFLVLGFSTAQAENAGLLWPVTLEGKFAFPALFEDGENGALLVSRVIKPGDYDNNTGTVSRSLLQARRVSPNGQVRWLTNLSTYEAAGQLSLAGGLVNTRMAARSADGKHYFFGFPGTAAYLPGNAGGLIFNKSAPSNAIMPAIVSDGAGGFYGSGDTGAGGVVAADRITKDGIRHSNWASRVEVANKPNQEAAVVREMAQYPTICRSSDGGMIMVWMQSATTEYDLGTSSVAYIQKLSGGGAIQWNSGQPLRLSPSFPGDPNATGEANAEIPVVESDGAGGAVAFWVQDRRNFKQNYTVWAARVTSVGTFEWGPKRMVWTAKRKGALTIAVTQESDGRDYVYAAWVSEVPDSTQEAIYVQKFKVEDGNSPADWPAAVEIERDIESEFRGSLFSDSQGGAIFPYSTNAPSRYSRVCRVDGSGVRWTKTLGVALWTTSIWTDGNELLVGLGSYEASGRDVAVIARLKISDGSEVWRRSIDPGGYNYLVAGVEDGAGGFIVTWWNRANEITGEDDMFAKNIYAQRISGSGEVIWKNATAVTVESANADNTLWMAGLAYADTGSALGPIMNLSSGAGTVARVGDITLYQLGLQAQKLDAATGEKKWGPDGVTFYQNITPTQEVGSIAVAADEAGGAAFVWVWIDNPNDNEIYARWINENGDFATGIITLEGTPDWDSFPQVEYAGNNSALALWDREYWVTLTHEVVVRSFSRNYPVVPLGDLKLAGSGTSGIQFTRKSLALEGNKIITVVDDYEANQTKAVLMNQNGTEIGRLSVPAGYLCGQIASSEGNNLLFSYWASVEAWVMGSIYISKIPISSISGTVNVSTADAWSVISREALQSSFPLYSIRSDGSGGAVVTFLDFRKLTASEANNLKTLLNTGLSAIASPEFASYDGDIYAQRIDVNGNRLWGESGILVGNGNYLQDFLDGVKSTPGGSMIFAYLDTSSSQGKGALGWLAEADTKIQKVGPISLARFSGIAVDGRRVTEIKQEVSSKPTLTVGVEDPNNVRYIQVFVNDEEYARVTVIQNANDIALNLPDAGNYKIKIVMADIYGVENTETLTVTSPGASATGTIGQMAVSPSPYNPSIGAATISYVLASDADVQLVIFSPVGGEPIMNRSFRAGTQGGMASYNAITWDGKLPSGELAGTGIYPIKLIVSGREQKGFLVIRFLSN